MNSACILTDNSVQFPVPTFAGRNLVRIIPLTVDYSTLSANKQKIQKATDFPPQVDGNFPPRLSIPDDGALAHWMICPETNLPYDQVLAIFTSSHLCSIFSRMQALLHSWIGKCNILLIDSLTTSIGLGVLVQAAAESLQRGASLAQAEQVVRGLIPRIYSIFCTPNFSYLYNSGIIDVAQAHVGDMLGLLPVYVIEEGQLSPLEKVKNQRQVIDLYQEFIDEFEHLSHIAFVQGSLANPQIGRLLREHSAANAPKTPFTEHNINLALAILFGPQASGVTVIESA